MNTHGWRNVEDFIMALAPVDQPMVRALIAHEVARERFRVVAEFSKCADSVLKSGDSGSDQ